MKEHGGTTATVVVLVLVIVAAVGFIAYRVSRNRPATTDANTEIEMICTNPDCGHIFVHQAEAGEEMELQMGGRKITCPECGRTTATAAATCESCGAKVPSPGMLAMEPGMTGDKPPICPKCGKPLFKAAGGGSE